MTADLEQLANKADALLAELTTPQTVVVIRGLLNEAGVADARRNLHAALAGLQEAQAAKRRADNNERDAKEKLSRTEVDAEWALVAPDTNEAGAKLLAADKAAWKKQMTAAQPEVKAQAGHLRQMEHEVAVARDALTIADKRLSACRADLDAAIATLEALCLALPARSRT